MESKPEPDNEIREQDNAHDSEGEHQIEQCPQSEESPHTSERRVERLGEFRHASGDDRVRREHGRRKANGGEEQKINGGKAIAGGISVGLGFGLGIAGISVNPGQAARSRAEASRFVYFPPEDPKEEVLDRTGRYNQAVRDRCERPPAP